MEGEKKDNVLLLIMKKIMSFVTLAFLMVSSWLFVDLYIQQERESLIRRGEQVIHIESEVPDLLLEGIQQIAEDHQLNVQKAVYRLTEEGGYVVDIYAYISDEDSFYQGITLYEGERLHADSPQGAFIASMLGDDPLQLGTFSLLDKQTQIRIKNFSDARSENLNGAYYFSGIDDEGELQLIKQEITSYGMSIDESAVEVNGTSADSTLITYLPLLFLLVVISSLYYYILAYKEIAVMLLHGYSRKQVIMTKLQGLLTINLIELIAAWGIICAVMTWITSSPHPQFYLHTLLFLFLVMIGVSLIEALCGLICGGVSIRQGLNHQRPQLQINFLNYLVKIGLCAVVVFASCSAVKSIQNFEEKHYDFDAWQETINYAYTSIAPGASGNFEHTSNGNSYEIGSIMQKLYQYLEEDGAMLMRANAYYQHSDDEKALIDQEYPEYINCSIEVNGNYLRRWPVYDRKGKQLLPLDENEDKLVILVPEKYRDQEKAVREFYMGQQRLRYFDENLYNELVGKQEITTKQEIEFLYYADGQRFFSYDPKINEEENCFITDPIIMVTNGMNRGTDVYYSIVSSGDLLFPIDDPQAPRESIRDDLEKSGASDMVAWTPTVFSRVDEQQYDLQLDLQRYGFMLAVSLAGYIIMTIFITINYIESNKQLNAVKRLMGYSFMQRNGRYLLLHLIPVLLLTSAASILFGLMRFGWILFLLLATVEIVTAMISLWYYGKKSISDVLKRS